MGYSLLVWAAVLALPPAGTEQPLADLVARLGSPRFSEREGASKALEAKGREALAALRMAREAVDPELRSRAAALVERIESDLVVRPTTLALDFQNRALPEIAKVFAERSGIPTLLDPEAMDVLGGRHVTLEAKEPVPFWTALDRLCQGGLLRAEYGSQETPDGHVVVGIRLADAGGMVPCPTSDHGPFRVKLVGLHYQRERRLDQALGAPRFIEQFQAQIEVMAEPRLLLGQRGNLKLLEAVDDKGNSLLPAGVLDVDEQDLGERLEFNGGTSLNLTLPLHYPREAGQKIAKLRGSLPLALAARKSNPLVVPLANAAGKTFQGDDVALTVHALRTDPNEGDASIELRLRPRDADAVSTLAVELLEHQIEVVDAQGRELPTFAQELDSQGSEARLTLRLGPAEGAAAPRQIRFYGLIRANADVPFAFADVDMP